MGSHRLRCRILILSILLLPIFSEAADRYWVGGTGNWSDNTNHWSASSGGAGGASVPTASDNCIFNGSSSTLGLAYTVTVDVAATCLDFTMDAPGGIGAKVTWAGNSNLTISGSMNLTGGTAGITRTYGGNLAFISTTATQIINANGVSFGSPITVDGVGGTRQLGSPLVSTAGLNMTGGLFDLNGHSLTIDNFWTNNLNVRSLRSAGGTITVTGSGTAIDINTATNLTFVDRPSFISNYSGAANRWFLMGSGAGSEATAANLQVTAGTGNAEFGFGSLPGHLYNLDFTGFSGTLTQQGSGNLNVYGNLTLSNTMTTGTYSTLAIVFMASSAGKTITTNGVTINRPIAFNGAGSWQLQDHLTTTNNITLISGTLDVNSKNFNLTGTSTQTLDGSFSVANLTRSGGDLILTGDQNISGAFTAGGTSCASRIVIKSNLVSAPRTITAASASLQYVEFQSITAAGAAAPFSGTCFGDRGGNSNITFTAAGNKFWVGGTGNWNGTVWATSSGGVADPNNLPLPQDTCVFDTNSFSANGQSVTVNGSYAIGNISFAAINRTGITFNLTSSPTFVGNVTLEANMVMSGTGTATFSKQSGVQTLTSAGVSWSQSFNIDSGAGTLRLADALNIPNTRTLTLTSGTFDMNAKATSIGIFSSAGTVTRAITSGGATLTLTGNNTTIWNSTPNTNLTLNGGLQVDANYSGSTGTRFISPNSTGEGNSINLKVSAGTDIVNLSNSINHHFNNVDFTGFSGTLANGARRLYGNLVISSGMSLDPGTFILTFSGTSGTSTITTAGKTLDFPVTIDGAGKTFQLVDPLTMGSTRILTVTAGTFNMNGQAVSAGFFSSNNTNVRSLTTGGATLTITGNSGLLWNQASGTFTYNDIANAEFTYNGATGTRTIASNSAAANKFNAKITAGTDIVTNSGSYNNLDFTGFSGTASSLYGLTITGNLTLTAGMTSTGSSSAATTFTSTSGTKIITTAGKTLDFPLTFDGVGGTWQLADALTLASTRTLTVTNGTFDMNNKAVSTGMFNSSNSNTRSITSGGAIITLTGNNASIWTTASVTGLTFNDQLVINSNYSGAVGTRTLSGTNGGATGPYPKINVTAGTDTVLITNIWAGIDFTGFAGTLSTSANPLLSGDLILSSGMTIPATPTAITLYAITGTKTFTTNGQTWDRPVTIDNTGGGTWQFSDNLTMGSTRALTLTNGIMDINGKTLSVGTFNSTNSNVRTIKSSVNGGKIITTQTTATPVFTAATSTNLTVDRATGSWTIEIGGNTTNIRTFAGGGKTWPSVTFTNTTAGGDLDFTGANTFKSIAVTNPPQTIRFTAGTTTTIEDDNGFPSGTAGNLVTIGSITIASHTLAKAGGGLVSVNYLSISRSTATPANTWYAGTTSTDGGNNSGWIFSLPPLRYWVGGTGNWSDAANHWATTSGGAPGAGNLPTATDNCYFDANSNSTNAAYTVTVDAAATCKDLSFLAKPGNGAGGNITFTNTTTTMTIYGSLTMLSGMTSNFSVPGQYLFAATTTGNTITSNGVTLNAEVYFNGAGGEWTLNDNLTPGNQTLTLTQGTLKLNGYRMRVYGFTSNGALTRSLDMSVANSTIDAASSCLTFWVTSSLTVSMHSTALITNLGGQGPTANVNGCAFTGGGLTYAGEIKFDRSFVGKVGQIAGANTIGKLTVVDTATNGDNIFSLEADQTVTGTFTVTGAAANQRVWVQSNTWGTPRTITAAAVAITDADFTDVTAAGAAIPWTGTRVGDGKGNSNITFTAGTNKYWVGNNGDWSAANMWATSSGGAGATVNYPLPQDTCIFDGNSFSGNGQIVTMNAGNAKYLFGTINFNAVPETAINWAVNTNVYTFGNVTLQASMVLGGINNLIFAGRNAQTITTAGVGSNGGIMMSSPGGTLTFADSYTSTGPSTGLLDLSFGTLNFNGQAISFKRFNSGYSTTRAITSGGTTLVLSGNSTFVWNVVATALTMNDALTVNLNYSGAVGTRTIAGGLVTESNTVNFKVSAGTDQVVFSSGQNIRNIDFTGFGGTWNWTTENPNMYGSLTLAAGMTISSGTGTLTFASTSGTKSILSSGLTVDHALTFNGLGGLWELTDNLTVGSTRIVQLSTGTFDLNGKILTTGLFNTATVTTRTLKSSLPGGKIKTTSTGAQVVFNATAQTNLTVDRTNDWTIEIGGDTATVRTFGGGGFLLWPAVTFTNATTGGGLDFAGSSTFKSLSVSTPPQTLRFTAATTTTIEDPNGFPSGTAGNLVTIDSITAASHTLAKAGTGIICSDYLSVSRSSATPSNKFFAKNSTNGGNNSGWSFASSCTPSRGTKFLPFFRR